MNRSIKPEIIVLVGLCTHLGCSPLSVRKLRRVDLGPKWVGGYFCPCRGPYDLAGRVYKSSLRRSDLPVPPHSYESVDIIVVGVGGESVIVMEWVDARFPATKECRKIT